MRDVLIIEDGVVSAREVGVPTDAERAVLARNAKAEADRMEADKATAEAAIVIPIARIASDPLMAPAFRRDAVESKIVELRDVAAHLSVPDTRVQVEADIYRESTDGGPLLWPRAYRDALLAATDYVDVAGWRLNKSAETLAAADAYRSALRGLPAAHPDPIAVVWPTKPDGI